MYWLLDKRKHILTVLLEMQEKKSKPQISVYSSAKQAELSHHIIFFVKKEES